MGKGSSGKKPHYADQRKREKFKKLHPEGRKAYARAKRKRRLKKRLAKKQIHHTTYDRSSS